jgi:hypothetical protein
MDTNSGYIPAHIWAFAILALLSAIYAIALETERGKWLATERTWVTVIIGCGIVLIVLLVVLPFESWLRVVAAFAIAGTPMAIRSLNNDWRKHG